MTRQDEIEKAQDVANANGVVVKFGDEYDKIAAAIAKADEWTDRFKEADARREADARVVVLAKDAALGKSTPTPAVVEEDSEMRDATGEEVEMEDVSALPKIIVKGKQREVPTVEVPIVEVPKKKKTVSAVASGTRVC